MHLKEYFFLEVCYLFIVSNFSVTTLFSDPLHLPQPFFPPIVAGREYCFPIMLTQKPVEDFGLIYETCKPFELEPDLLRFEAGGRRRQERTVEKNFA